MSTYRFLQDAYVNGVYYPAGTTASTADVGGTLPTGWVPTGNVDPADTAAIADFYAAGPQASGLIRTEYSPNPVFPPNFYWPNPPLLPIPPGIPPPFGPGDFANPKGFLYQRPNTEDVFNPAYFMTGAVLLNPFTTIFGSGKHLGTQEAPRTGAFTQGVLSFWMLYDGNLSKLNGSAQIIQTKVSTSGLPPPTNDSFACLNLPTVADPVYNNPKLPPPTYACIAMSADPVNMNFSLRDGLTGAGLVGVQVPYIPGYNSSSPVFTASWQDVGTATGVGGTAFPFTFNGNFFGYPIYLPPGLGAAFPCGGALYKQYIPGNIVQQVCNLPPGALPTPGVSPYHINSSWTQGPTTYANVPIEQFEGEVWLVTSSIQPGSTDPPPPGWHHYIFSWDTSQLVTDTNGSQCIRVQCAIDGGGGSVKGGPLFDTMPGPGTQPFTTVLEQGGTTGTLMTGGAGGDDFWNIRSAPDLAAAFAYCYFGVGSQFFDLTHPKNLNCFISPNGGAQNLGPFGENILIDQLIPMTAVWIHTGNADIPLGVPQGTVPFSPNFLYNGAQDNAKNPWEVIVGNIFTVPGPPFGI